MVELKLGRKALAKLILHAAKYPHCAVNGLLIGRKLDGRRLLVVDAVPLFHRWHMLTPMTELALMQVAAGCSYVAEGKVEMVGYYHANERFDDDSVGVVAEEVAEKIVSQFGDAVLLMVRNARLMSIASMECVKAYTFADHRWQPADSNTITVDDAASCEFAVRGCLLRKLYRQLADFDDHLEDVTQDFWNVQLGDEIESLF